MLTKVAFGLALAVATVSGSFAATHAPARTVGQTIYNPNGAYVVTDPDRNVRFEVYRDSDRAHAN